MAQLLDADLARPVKDLKEKRKLCVVAARGPLPSLANPLTPLFPPPSHSPPSAQPPRLPRGARPGEAAH